MLLIDPTSGAPRPAAELALALFGGDSRVVGEFRASQIEIVSPVCVAVADVARELSASRRVLATGLAPDTNARRKRHASGRRGPGRTLGRTSLRGDCAGGALGGTTHAHVRPARSRRRGWSRSSARGAQRNPELSPSDRRARRERAVSCGRGHRHGDRTAAHQSLALPFRRSAGVRELAGAVGAPDVGRAQLDGLRREPTLVGRSPPPGERDAGDPRRRRTDARRRRRRGHRAHPVPRVRPRPATRCRCGARGPRSRSHHRGGVRRRARRPRRPSARSRHRRAAARRRAICTSWPTASPARPSSSAVRPSSITSTAWSSTAAGRHASERSRATTASTA